MKSPILLSALLLPALLLTADPADACSPLLPVIGSVAPTDGATAVPSNPALLVHYPHGQARHQVTYEVVGSTVTMDLGELPEGLSDDPIGTLALPTATAGTQVRVTLTPLENSGESDTHTTTFTYGSATDSTPPAAPPAPTLNVKGVPKADHTCGPSKDGDEIIVPVPSGLDADAVGYAVFATPRNTPADSNPYERKRWALLADDPGELRLGYYGDTHDVCVTARAVDQAGNWSAPSAEACVPVNSGCTAAQGSLPVFGALGLWLGLAGLLRRRRG